MIIGITGCTGGLGHRFLDLIDKKENRIRILVRNPSQRMDIESLQIENSGNTNYTVFPGDLTQPDSLKNFITGLDVCINFAAQVNVASKEAFMQINHMGVKNLCDAIINSNPGCRLLHCSTISTLRVNLKAKHRSTPYALSKYYGDMEILKAIKEHGLKATIIYSGILFGPYDKYVVPSLIKIIRKGKMKLIQGGEKSAPVIYCDDLCNLFIKALNTEKSIGKQYVSVEGLEIGIHEIIKHVSRRINLPIDEKVHSVLPFMLLARLLEWLYRIFPLKGRPPITRASVDILSANIGKYSKTYDDPSEDLGWTQTTSKEKIFLWLDQAINSALGKR